MPGRIVVASDDGTARLWNGEGEVLAVLEGHTSGVNTAAFNQDGSRIVTASDDGTARVWVGIMIEADATLVEAMLKEATRRVLPLLTEEECAAAWGIGCGEIRRVVLGE
ncbi:MAG: hypothetical protein KC423_00635, partial [Anaerolineales bacterium]|nr:hypothetical protein [Anaerolineales bacterium]